MKYINPAHVTVSGGNYHVTGIDTDAIDAAYKARIIEAGLDSLESDASDKSIGGIVGLCTYIAGAADIPLDAFADNETRAHHIYRLLAEIRANLKTGRKD